MKRVNQAAAAVCMGFFAGVSGAQEVVYTPVTVAFTGVPFDGFGSSLDGAGDVNNDGFDDIIVGAPFDDANGANAGRALVYSGATGAVLYTLSGDSPDDVLGFSVAGAGDVNNDGFDDFVVGAPGDDNNAMDSGSVRVYSGLTGTVLYTFDGDSAGAVLGSFVAGAGDVNNDGFDDVIAAAQGVGIARVFSGATGATLYTFNGDSAEDEFGKCVAGAGDVNNDGFDDLIVGAWLADNNGANSGSALVFSGATGATLYTFNGDSAGDRFGWSAAGAGDVNNDGFDDLIVGAPLNDNNDDGDSGSARVFSGANGAALYTLKGDSAGDRFGESVAGAGDVNNDGFDDLIVGAPDDDKNGMDSGSAQVFSGSTGTLLHIFNGGALLRFALSVAGAGDVNNDGFADVIAGRYAPIGIAQVFIFTQSVWPTTPPPAACPGDSDGNGVVNFADITSVLSNFNVPCP